MPTDHPAPGAGRTRLGYLGRRFSMVGNLTYSSYLLRFPLQFVVFEVTRYIGIANSFFYSSLSLVLFFVLLIPICLLSYYYFETPTQKHVRAFMLSDTKKAKNRAWDTEWLNYRPSSRSMPLY